MSNEESKNDLVKEARELLSKITPWPWDTKQGDRCWHVGSLDGTFETACIMFAGGNGTSEGNAKLIARAPELVSSLCDEVEELRRRNETQADSIMEFQEEQRTFRAVLGDALRFLESDGASGTADDIEERLRSAITPKGSEQ